MIGSIPNGRGVSAVGIRELPPELSDVSQMRLCSSSQAKRIQAKTAERRVGSSFLFLQQLPYFSPPSRARVSMSVSGLSEIASMPSDISHWAKSG